MRTNTGIAEYIKAVSCGSVDRHNAETPANASYCPDGQVPNGAPALSSGAQYGVNRPSQRGCILDLQLSRQRPRLDGDVSQTKGTRQTAQTSRTDLGLSGCASQTFVSHRLSLQSDKIILEIRDTFKDWRVILGEHRWEEILKVPADNEKEQCSQIFYCRFTHDREVQKHGWKRIDVPQSWFRDWQLFNGYVRSIDVFFPVARF